MCLIPMHKNNTEVHQIDLILLIRIIRIKLRKLDLFTVRTDYSNVGSRSFQFQNPMNEIGDFSFTDFCT